ncbi:hypothetical protein QE152_g5487 [Popillia japonica]|uniref:Uncharacterized protein n=1 Tax=Popillia japonica TaxID=7064 RepID=A0AAW1MRW1_POPJA
MESIALARLRTSVEHYRVFVEYCGKFEAIFCIPFDRVKFDPILISGENLCQFSSHENGNIIEIKLVRIGTISIEFSTTEEGSEYLQKMVKKLQVMKRLNLAGS